MKLQHINFCGSVEAVGYFKNQSELTQTARKLRAVFYYAAYFKAYSAHIFRKNMQIIQMIACVSAYSVL